MEVRTHTDRTLRRYQIGVALVSAGLSAALIAPQIYAGPITSVVAAGSVLGMTFLRKDMTRGVADLTRVSRGERRRFLVENTGWLIATLITCGAVFVLVFGRWPAAVRIGFGHVALLLMAASSIMMARTAAAHGIKVTSTTGLDTKG